MFCITNIIRIFVIDVFQETAKKAAIIRLSTANSFELIHYQDKHIALLIPFDRIQKISY